MGVMSFVTNFVEAKRKFAALLRSSVLQGVCVIIYGPIHTVLAVT